SKQVAVKVSLADSIPDLALEPGVELVFGDGFQNRASLIGRRRLGVERHIHRLRRDAHLINALPRPFEIGSSGRDYAYLRKIIATLFLLVERSGDRIRSNGGIANTLGTPEAGFYGAFVLVDCIDAGNEVSNQKPPHEAKHDSHDDSHMCSAFEQ